MRGGRRERGEEVYYTWEVGALVPVGLGQVRLGQGVEEGEGRKGDFSSVTRFLGKDSGCIEGDLGRSSASAQFVPGP